jgi:hypothetical protein
MPNNKVRAPRHRRSAAEVMNSQNVLIVRKMVQEGLIPRRENRSSHPGV